MPTFVPMLEALSRGFTFIMCHKFSMGLASGEFPGQSRTCTFLLAKKAIVEADLWQGARSCWKMNSFTGNTRHCPIMSISLIISLWYLWEFKWPSIFFKRPTPYLEKQPQTWICKLCRTVLFVQIGLKRSWSNLLMVPLSQWLSVRNMHSSQKTTWYQSSVVHCSRFLAHSILSFC